MDTVRKPCPCCGTPEPKVVWGASHSKVSLQCINANCGMRTKFVDLNSSGPMNMTIGASSEPDYDLRKKVDAQLLNCATAIWNNRVKNEQRNIKRKDT